MPEYRTNLAERVNPASGGGGGGERAYNGFAISSPITGVLALLFVWLVPVMGIVVAAFAILWALLGLNKVRDGYAGLWRCLAGLALGAGAVALAYLGPWGLSAMVIAGLVLGVSALAYVVVNR